MTLLLLGEEGGKDMMMKVEGLLEKRLFRVSGCEKKGVSLIRKNGRPLGKKE